MSAIWRYPIHEMTEMPMVDVYFDGIGAFEIFGENVRLIPYKLVTERAIERVTIDYAFVRPLVGWAESLEHAQAVLKEMPVPRPEFASIKRLGH